MLLSDLSDLPGIITSFLCLTGSQELPENLRLWLDTDCWVATKLFDKSTSFVQYKSIESRCNSCIWLQHSVVIKWGTCSDYFNFRVRIFSQLVFNTAGMAVVCAQCFSQRTFNIHSTPLASRQTLTENAFQCRYQIVLLKQSIQSMIPQMGALKSELERFSSNFTCPPTWRDPIFLGKPTTKSDISPK